MNEINDNEIILKLPGYKFLNSHFKVGSKIHVSDFYYAKKIFQNSSFAIRFAFILAKDIEKIIVSKGISDINEQGLTLIGYGQYSDLLLNLTRKILLRKLKLANERLNYNVLTDSEEMSFTKQRKPLYSFAIIIVPVATTFSTSVKIERKILDYKSESGKKIEILSPRLNVLLISDSKSLKPNVPTGLEKSFGWTNKRMNDRKVDIFRHFNNKGDTIEQTFYYNLLTDWQDVEDCKYCNPKDAKDKGKELPLDERPLFEADKNPFLPPPNFGVPRGRVIDKDDSDRSFILTADMVFFGHHYRNDNHFSYSLDTEKFLEANRPGVISWLNKVKKSAYFKGNFTEADNILIIAPSHHSNAEFIDLVNDELFAASANIIHYDATRDYVQNFDVIYGTEIDKASKIVFVDDSLKSGSTFFRINQFIYNTQRKNTDSTKETGISLCLFLLNKAEPLTVQLISDQLLKNSDGMFAFAHLHLYTASSFNTEPPLKAEVKRYKGLIKESYLESLKVYFRKHYLKLSIGKEDRYTSGKRERHLMMLDATHRVFQFFSDSKMSPASFKTFMEFSNQIQDKTRTVITYKLNEKQEVGYMSDFDACLLKVIAQLPFTLYQPLKEKVFEWTLALTDDFIEKKSHLIEEGNFTYSDLQTLKFLMRRLCLLKSGYLITSRMLTMVEKLHREEGIPRLISICEKNIQEGKEVELEEEKKVKLQLFGVFYCGQVKELIFSNEARCIQVEEEISKYKTNLVAPGFRQIMRILRVENSILIERFYSYLIKQEYWPPAPTNNHPSELSIDDIRNVIEKNITTRNFSYLLLDRFLSVSKPEIPLNNTAFLNFLWLKWYLEPAQQEIYRPLLTNTENIFSCLRRIFDPISEQKDEKSKTGFFFIVNDSQQTPLIFYDKSPDGESRFESELLSNSYLTEFLNGSKDETSTYTKSIIELRKSDDGTAWEDIYAVNNEIRVQGLDPKILANDYNRLILVRLNKKVSKSSVSENLGRGIIGFYYRLDETNGETKTQTRDANIVRYLHILRKPLSAFVKKHLENNEFTDWRISENTKKLLLLSGHGKEMLHSLARKNESRYRDIVLNLEHIQVIFLLNDSAKEVFAEDEVEKKFNQFYRIEGSSYITRDYFNHLEKMACELYEYPEVEMEMKEDIEGISFDVEDVYFPFSKSLLDIICFEIFVNAKKNSWIFSDISKVPGYSFNHLKVTAKTFKENGKERLLVEIRSTGPEVEASFIKNVLNHPYVTAKPNDVTAGTTLIKTLLRKFKLGEIKYASELIDNNLKFAWFIVTIKLNEM